MLAERMKRTEKRRPTSATGISARPGRAVGFAIVVLTFATSCTETVNLGPASPPTDAAQPSTAGTEPASHGSVVPVLVDDAVLPVLTRDGWIRAAPVTANDRFARDGYRDILEEQLSLYPSVLCKRIGLNSVVLCKDLTFEGSRCVAFADVEHGRLYMSVGAEFLPAFIKRTIHHEIFHQVNFADDGKLDADSRWESLNTPDFRYSHDADRLHNDPDATRPDESLKGFLNRYATSSPAEDKAELYAALVVEPDYVRLRTSRTRSSARRWRTFGKCSTISGDTPPS